MCLDIFNGWNPIVNGCTLASYVMFVMKHEYIKQGDVGYVPENGMNRGNNSMLALKYLQWLEKNDPSLKLKYQLKGGEHQIQANGHNYYVDGYNEATDEVFEVHGCLWHGCKKCFPNREKKNRMCGDLSAQESYDRTIQREEDIRGVVKKLNVVWECEIYEMMEKNKTMKKFFELNKYTRCLLPREALYGGRTQAFRSITKAFEDTILNYFDYVSMYPYLNAGGTSYPRGNPKVVTDTDKLPKPGGLLKLRGLVYCDVLPIQDAAIGYLPQRICKKLMFTLCRTCAESQNISGTCTHTLVSQRYLTGVWTTEELNNAISKGYKVLKYHEIWYWPDEAWVKGGFFADYIKPLLKLKHESSGWPKENMSDAEKEAYIGRIFEKDGVLLDASKIKKNTALRSLCKIFLNSAWGKFGQNPMKSETRLILKADAVTLTNFFNDARYEPVSMIPFGKHKLWISRKPKKETLRPAPFTNLAIAAITTSAARLRLTEAMEKVGVENMIYCDTDSLIFKQKKGEDPLKDLKGEQLGSLVSEIPEGNELVEVITMAPKVYALKIKKADGTFTYCVKAKGMTLNSGNSKKITFDTMKKSMKEFIEYGVTDALEGNMMTFKRGEHALDGLWTCVLKKRLSPRMDKGHYVEGVVAPFGQLQSNVDLIDDYPF
ncbi:CRE-TAF-3 protein [Caenorhabditis remanei]|uniref:DNA-directed DNA polymerase n=1 Tax=Caenorhabditis remanei TaxID=31234 RepID=E3NK01_CAERE|nr:CRE-TAF-3 protein [Caenorhabditis remanei]